MLRPLNLKRIAESFVWQVLTLRRPWLRSCSLVFSQNWRYWSWCCDVFGEPSGWRAAPAPGHASNVRSARAWLDSTFGSIWEIYGTQRVEDKVDETDQTVRTAVFDCLIRSHFLGLAALAFKISHLQNLSGWAHQKALKLGSKRLSLLYEGCWRGSHACFW